MRHWNRRNFLGALARSANAAAALALFPDVIRSALATDAHYATGTIQDVAHVVVLTQENRSFDHYFGAMRGVRGFADRFAQPIESPPGATSRSVWQQPRTTPDAGDGFILPFHLDTQANFSLMRAEGTPHSWLDAQQAWDHGRMSRWTHAKGEHSLGYYTRSDLPFHYALADAFTVCDAYHCSFHGGTNTNRLFLWTGTNDPQGLGNGPATYNDLDTLGAKPGVPAYTWTTYAERLQAAGVSWQVYQDMADNYDDNPLVGFQVFRDAHAGATGTSAELRARALSTRDLVQLKADVRAGQLPQVSWIVASAASSEHPEHSSPAQGADYVARVLDALTANPEVWSRTVLIVNFDENDGYFDHVASPAPPSIVQWHADPGARQFAGASTVDTSADYHEKLLPYRNNAQERGMLHRAYGLGPRVPMLVISPWSRGGWVNSQVFDHTSVIRFLERRFGVVEPQISPWRRAVCGDLTSAFDFSRPNSGALPKLPATLTLARRAATLPTRATAVAPHVPAFPQQERGLRPSRALPYELQVDCLCRSDRRTLELMFVNGGAAGAVFHVIDRLNLAQIPRRYTVEGQKQLTGTWSVEPLVGAYDLWVLGPNGFHRHFSGRLDSGLSVQARPEVEVRCPAGLAAISIRLHNSGDTGCTFELHANAYHPHSTQRFTIAPRAEARRHWDLRASGGWYDFSVGVQGLNGFVRRFAGRMETGAHSTSDPFDHTVATATATAPLLSSAGTS